MAPAIRLLSVLALTLPALALYDPSGPVPLLTPKTFDQKIRKSNHSSIVEFFAPWCGHCKNLAPAYTKAAEHMEGIFTFAAVDCDDQVNRGLCQEFGIEGFPTLKYMKPYHGKVDAQDYRGPRTAKGLTEFAKQNMENLVVRLTDDNLSSFLENNNDTAKAIMFSSKSATSPMYKSLAIDLQGRMIFAQVRDTNKKVLEELNVDKFPTLLVLPGGSTPGIVYSSELKRNPMYEFLAEYAPDAALRTPSAQPRLRKPTADYTPKKITEISDFIPFCFDAGTCFLFLSSQEEHLKTFSAVNQRLNAKKNLHIYTTELFEGKEDLFGWEKMPAVIALNGKKGWFKTYDGEIVERDIAEWIDGVKMGDGKKIKIGDEVKGLLGFSKSTSSKSSETTTSQSTDEGVEKPATEGVEEIFGEEKEAIHDEL